MGGNIGVPVLALEPPSMSRVHVLELSTFQIDLTPSLRPSVGAILNLTPDHLDRHGSMANYAAIKERLVSASRHAVVATDDDYTRAMAHRLTASAHLLTTVSALDSAFDSALDSALGNAAGAGIVARGTTLVQRGRTLADLAGIPTLRGWHNAQNAATAVAVLFAIDPNRDLATLQAALRTFAGLPHRMEEVARAGNVLFVNDSKATNADAAEKALTSFDDIFWIAGGRAKEGGIAPLAPYFSRVRKAYLDWRGHGRLRPDARWRPSVRALRHSRHRGRARRG